MGFFFLSKEERAKIEAEKELARKNRLEEANMEAERKEAEAKKRIAVESELRDRFSKSPVLDMLFEQLKTLDWATTCQSAQDNGLRRVTLTEDTLAIKWAEWHSDSRLAGFNKWGIAQYEQTSTENIHNQVCYSYTKSGYAPLDAYYGDVYIPLERVLELWSDEIKRRLCLTIPGCDCFEGIDSFSYFVPRPTKSMF